MKSIKKIVCLGLSLAVIFSLSACNSAAKAESANSSQAKSEKNSTAESSKEQTDSGKKLLIGFSQCTTDSPYYVALQDAAEKAAIAADAEFRLVNAANNVSKQNQDVQDLIQAGCDVIILDPVDSSSVTPAVKACVDADVPLVTVNRPANQEGATAHVGEDNYKMGNLVGQEAIKLLGGKGNVSGKILEIMGSGGNNNTINRSEGFHDAFEGENVEIVQSSYCDFNRAKAVAAAQDLLLAHPDVKLIYAHNDDMAVGGMQVAEKNGMQDVFVCGVDGLMEAVELIEEGKYSVTTMNDPQLQGQESVLVAIQICNGEEVESFVDVGTTVITKDNVDEYITDQMFATQIKEFK